MTVRELSSGDQVAAVCPACATGFEGPHELLKPATQATVKCLECDHVHKVTIDTSTDETVRVIVSVGDESVRTATEVPRGEQLAVGEEFVVEADDTILGVRITSLELPDGSRCERAPGKEVQTIWTRGVDNVALDVTIHAAGGDRDGTRSQTFYLPGDEAFEVGKTVSLGEMELRIEGMVVTEDSHGYPRRNIDQSGTTVPAKDIDRLYAREQRDEWSTAWDDF